MALQPELFAFDLETNEWERIFVRKPVEPTSGAACVSYYKKPTLMHTEDGIVSKAT